MNIRAIDQKFEAMATNSQEIAWLLLRVLTSVMFMSSGFAKLFGAGAVPVIGGMDFFGINLGVNMLWIAGMIEFFGGLLVLVGLFTRWAALLCSILMIMAYLSAHPAWFPTLNGGALATMYFLAFLAIFAYGPGRYSIDAKMRERNVAVPAGEGI